MTNRLYSGKTRFFAALAACLCLVAPVANGADEGLEYQVKAAFLLNFPKFIGWPPTAFPDSSSPFNICILGDDPFGHSLEQMVEGENVNGRKLVVEKLHHTPAPKACQILFIPKAEKDLAFLSGLGPGVLTVGEGDSFLREGGMIAFILDNRRVRFDIGQGAAGRAGLTLSSKLLRVARSVEK